MKDLVYENFDKITQVKKQYAGEYIVVKFGGSIAANEDSVKNIARQIDFLQNTIGAKVIVIHGGQEQANAAFENAGINCGEFLDGVGRITTKNMIPVFDQALRGLNNKIATKMEHTATDLTFDNTSGHDRGVIMAQPIVEYTGKITAIDKAYFDDLQPHIVPVFYSVCKNKDPLNNEDRLNVNADDMAVAIAEAVGARRLFLVSDIDGVLDKAKNIIPTIDGLTIDRLIKDGTITGGMINKVKGAQTAAHSLPNAKVVILNGHNKDRIISEVLCQSGAGTMIRQQQVQPPAPSPSV